MNKNILNWILFVSLSFIWGSSFILMKEGMVGLNAYQVASIRIITSGLVLIPVAWKHFTKIPRNKLLLVFLSGVLGSLLPAYLFCIAEQGIDSSLAGTLNSLTPIFVILTGAVFFKMQTSTAKVTGILIAFAGTLLLFFSKPNLSEPGNLLYIFYVIIATFCYGINVNLVHRHLSKIPSLHIVSVALTGCAIPALWVLFQTGYFSLDFTSKAVWHSTLYASLLGVVGTSLASILFYMLIKRAGTVFSSMVTYGIPFVAIFWGILYKESIGWMQVASLLVILAGVYVANRKK